jgi:uncharacterized repeat protein (TIGR04138 family)
MQQVNFDEIVERIAAQDARFHRDAYYFLREALDFTQKQHSKPRKPAAPGAPGHHVTGQELLDGIRRFALQQYGPMARTLLEEWGIRRCEDFGEIVFNMVEHRLLGKTEKDSREDFTGGYDFEEAFEEPFRPGRRQSSKAKAQSLR